MQREMSSASAEDITAHLCLGPLLSTLGQPLALAKHSTIETGSIMQMCHTQLQGAAGLS